MSRDIAIDHGIFPGAEMQVLRLAGVGFATEIANATGIARSLGWPQPTQTSLRPLGWLSR